MSDAELLNRFAAIVGDGNALTSPSDIAPHLTEWRKRWTGATPLVLLPGSTREVSAILKLANQTRTAIVPQGGNTGLVGGQVPDASGNQIIVSTRRLNRIRAIDPASYTATVEAGVILQTLQTEAERHDRLFPLSLASQGSCQIGGNLSSNAGGTGALAHGVARDLCLGLEVVLANGDVLNDLSTLKKDNTGYNLRHLFIGAEGTLGIITAAVVKLSPRPRGTATAWFAVQSPEAALELLMRAQSRAGSALTAFELVPRLGIDFTTRHIPGVSDPLQNAYPWYVLAEISSSDSQYDADARLGQIAEEGMAGTLVADGIIAASLAQRAAFWRLREGLSESQLPEGASIKHDISVPVARIPAFMAAAQSAVLRIEPDARIVAFGHLGDGNLHYNISQPVGGDRAAFIKLAPSMTEAIHGLVRDNAGSISAEHGIGQMKRQELARTKDPVALATMRAIKATLDPNGIMNPGKLL
jgi:FAD/FMN-containing dehydrogenase